MLTSAIILAFIATCLVIEATPGPNMGYLALLSAREGRHRGLAAVAGVALGLGLIGAAAATGVAVFVAESPALYHTLRWAGVAYMLWLAWDAWRGESKTEEGQGAAAWLYFRRGLVTNLLNPKAFIFYITILPRFAGADPALAEVLTLTGIYVMVATAMHIAIVMAAGAARPFLEDAKRAKIVRRVFALLLAGIAIWFAATTGNI